MNTLFICLVILTLIILLVFKKIQSSFGENEYNQSQKKYLDDTKSVRDTIKDIITNPDYAVLINNVPGQTIFDITGDPPTVTKNILEGDTSKLTDINRTELITLTNNLITALNTFISIASNASSDVYTPEKLQTFLIYYKNMLNNTQIIFDYLNSS